MTSQPNLNVLTTLHN